MGEGKKVVEDDPEDTAVLKIAQQAKLLLEARRKKENAKFMAKLMKNFNYDLLRGDGGDEEVVEEPPLELTDEMELDEVEAERLQKLRDMEEEVATGALFSQERCGPQPKYEAPLIVQLRSVETVDELYNLADKIIPLSMIQKR